MYFYVMTISPLHSVYDRIFAPPPFGAGGILFLVCPSVRLLVSPTTLSFFSSCRMSANLPDRPWPFFHSPVSLSVHLSEEVSGHFLENASKDCPEIRHADVSWSPSELIKSPRYTGGDFMFLYWFVRRRRRRRRRPQILVHAITFEQLFGFLSFLARLLALTCRLPD